MDAYKQLGLLYEQVLTSTDDRFFLLIKKYIDYLFLETSFRRALDNLNKQKKKDSLSYDSICKEIVLKSQEIRDNLIKRINEDLQLKDDPRFKKILESQFNMHLSGKTISSSPLPESLLNHLEDCFYIIETETINGFKDLDLLKQQLYKKYFLEKENYELIKKASEWNALDNLLIVTCLDNNSELNKKREHYCMLMKRDMQQIISGKIQLSKSKRDSYVGFLNVIHSYVNQYKNNKIITWANIKKVGIIIGILAGLITILSFIVVYREVIIDTVIFWDNHKELNPAVEVHSFINETIYRSIPISEFMYVINLTPQQQLYRIGQNATVDFTVQTELEWPYNLTVYWIYNDTIQGSWKNESNQTNPFYAFYPVTQTGQWDVQVVLQWLYLNETSSTDGITSFEVIS